MRRARAGVTSIILFTSLLTVLIVGLSCANPFGAKPIPLRQELPPEEVAAAVALGERVTEGAFPPEDAAACSENGDRFLWLAAKHSDPLVLSAAMRAGAACLEGVIADPQADPAGAQRLDDLSRVVAQRLADADTSVLIGALTAASTLLPPLAPDHPLVLGLVSLAADKRYEVRYEALVVLDRRAWATEPIVSIAFLQALQTSDAPWLVTEVLRRVRYRASGLASSDSFRSAVMVLTQDLDPGIRGRAALVLARLAPEDEEVKSTLLRMLSDPHGFVRSAVAEALSEVGDPSVIPELIERIDDPARNTWDMLPFTRLDGTTEIPHHVGSLYERVDDAYLRAIVTLSEPMGDKKFVYREVKPRYRDLDIIAATRDAKRWFEENGNAVPKQKDAPPKEP